MGREWEHQDLRNQHVPSLVLKPALGLTSCDWIVFGVIALNLSGRSFLICQVG